VQIFKRILLFVVAVAAWAAVSIYGGLYGWWLSAVAPKGDVDAFMSAQQALITEQNKGNVSWFLYHDGKSYYGQHSAVGDSLDKDTLFPLASMSKMVAGLAAAKLSEQGRLDLDAPVSSYLKQWQLAESNFDNDKVTVRALLSHTAGLGDRLGFGDYSAEETLPSTVESLNKPRGSKAEVKIRVVREPGSDWSYSGGGYLIVEHIIEEISGQSYAQYVKENLLKPLAMQRSSFDYLGKFDNISNSYDENGNQVALSQYASKAATALSSSSHDMSLLALALLNENSSAILNQDSIKQLRKPIGFQSGAPIWGAGTMLYVPVTNDDFIYGHGGSNDPAINTSIRINPENKSAFVILATGNKKLAYNMAYEWTLWQSGMPDFLAFETALGSAMLPFGIGFVLIVLFFVFRVFRKA